MSTSERTMISPEASRIAKSGAVVEECAQPMATAGVPQLAQRLGLDLSDALARDREILADLLQRVLASVVEPEAHLDDFLFARSERLEYLRRLLLQIQIDHGFRQRTHGRLDEDCA